MAKTELKFNNGKFRILVLSDIHGIYDYNPQVMTDIGDILDTVKPDIVLLNGDQVWKDATDTSDHFYHFISALAETFESRNIPWAHVFGNHDDEGGLSREEQERIYESFSHCLSTSGPEDISGVGNYVLPVMSSDGSRPIFNIWAMDSHNNLNEYVKEFNLNPDMWFYRFDDPVVGNAKYDNVRFNQIHWYWHTSVEMEKEYGYKIPGMMFFHMPVPEFVVLYRNVAQTRYKGTRREGVGNSPFNSGLFNTLVERGDVKILVCGHDHINDFEGELCGVKLAMDAGISYDGYCDDDLRGGRVIDIDESNPSMIDTFMVRANDCRKI